MSKIFEGAKFGDTFKTKDGRKAIYDANENKWHYLILDGGRDIICQDDELYIIYGQSVNDDNLYDITDISYLNDRMGDYIYISTSSIAIKDAVRNIKSEERWKKWLDENDFAGN